MKNKKITSSSFYQTPFEMEDIMIPVFPDEIVVANPGDGDLAIQAAINRCVKLGGGTVHIPSGSWRSRGPIHLQSHIHLHFESGAIVEFSSSFSDYLPVVFTRWEGIECYNYSPLIYASNCEHIAITGDGTLYGNGAAWWYWKEQQGDAAESLYHLAVEDCPVAERVYGTETAALRPSFIQPINCKHVLLQGLTVIDGPQWTIHPVYCEDVIIQDLTIKTKGPNTDGINPDSCKNVLIENCTLSTGDDCIAINSGMNEDGWRVGKPSENIVIRNCQIHGGHGGIVIGSGMSGGIRNVYATGNTVSGVMWGIRLKSMRGRGGYIHNIWVNDTRIDNTENSAVHISMFYEYTTVEPRNDKPSDFSHIHLSNIHGHNNKVAIEIMGLPEQNIHDITLTGFSFSPAGEIKIRDVEEITMIN